MATDTFMIFQFITTSTIQSGQLRTFDSVNSVRSVLEYIKGGPQNRALFDLYFNMLELGDFCDSNAFGSGIYGFVVQ